MADASAIVIGGRRAQPLPPPPYAHKLGKAIRMSVVELVPVDPPPRSWQRVPRFCGEDPVFLPDGPPLPVLGTYIGRGCFGAVYALRDDPSRVAKVVPLDALPVVAAELPASRNVQELRDRAVARQDFEVEVAHARQLADRRVAPRVHGAWIAPARSPWHGRHDRRESIAVGVLCSERMQLTLEDYCTMRPSAVWRNRDLLRREIVRWFRCLAELDLTCADMHLSNCMVDCDDAWNVTRMRLVDVGRVTEMLHQRGNAEDRDDVLRDLGRATERARRNVRREVRGIVRRAQRNALRRQAAGHRRVR